MERDYGLGRKIDLFVVAQNFSQMQAGLRERPSYADSWTPPSSDVLKVNTDAAMLSHGVIGLEAVVRDCYGFIVAAGVRRIAAEWSVEMAEAMAALYGLSIADSIGARHVWCESDALGVVLGANVPKPNNTYLGSAFDVIRNKLASFDFASLSFVRNSGNCLAHFHC